MKQSKFSFLILGILNLLFAAALPLFFYWDGYARDNNIYRSQSLFALVGLVLLLCLVFFFLSIHRQKKAFPLCNLLFLAFGAVLLTMWLNSDGFAGKLPQDYPLQDRVKASWASEFPSDASE